MQNKLQVIVIKAQPTVLESRPHSRIDKLISRTTIHIDLARCIRAFLLGIAIIVAASNAPQITEAAKKQIQTKVTK
jgi:hypothetical protein